MASLYTHQSRNIAKTWTLMTIFFLVVIGMGWFFSYYFDNPNILIFFAFFSIIMNIASYWWSDKIVLRLAGAKPASREAHFNLYTAVENLSITAGLPMPKVYVIEDTAPNAFATGRDKEHAVIAATTGLLQILDKNELEGVIAHELSHIGNRDMLVSTVAVVLVGFVSIIADVFRHNLMWGNGDRDNKAAGILMIVGIIFSILAPIFAIMLQLAISRKREFLADASGALLTRYPEGLASALEKISRYSQPMHRQSNAIAHLYIANPKGSRIGERVAGLFATHPPVEKRISALLGNNMNIKDVENLAKLARIDLSEEEKAAMLKDMDSILGYVKQIEEVEVADVRPEHEVRNVWREDDVLKREFDPELITGQFPRAERGFLKVKKIL